MQTPEAVSLKEKFRNIIDSCPTRDPHMPSALGHLPPTISHNINEHTATLEPVECAAATASPIMHNPTTTPIESQGFDIKVVLIALVIVVAIGVCLFCMIPKSDSRDGPEDDEFEDAMSEFRQKISKQPQKRHKAPRAVEEEEDEYVDDDDQDDDQEEIEQIVAEPPSRKKKMQLQQQASLTSTRARLEPTKQPPLRKQRENDSPKKGSNGRDPMFQPL